ncbi:hypothetical protein DV736_g3941, partial [Chaetothyriales sp. CBS 134916]
MGVNDLAEYVAYHQSKLRQQSQPQPAHSPKNYGVNSIHSRQSYETSILNSKGIVVLDCFATWCGPCKFISPYIEELSESAKYKDAVRFYKLDVDRVEDVAAELGIRAMPTFLFFKDGKRVEEVVGANRPGIDKVLSQLL